ncbi:Ribosome associating protein [Brettanomyces nanus]|uniref:Translationally-controlled tumor protein homolog n=1 Tax=Eeniella nana TaxID=13502 RepID=A0A875S7F6_EENNA|nr:Ribosome associating protein [Brettanomyces nanus]QPG75104.1 Ribosome associating protein [Brettanomyces nanus]
MIIFKDIFSDDELLSDAYDTKEVNGVVIEADCQLIKVKDGADVDIGANPSAEVGDDDLEDGPVETVNNVVYSFNLQPTTFDKKSFMVYIKSYMKKVKAYLTEHDPDQVEVFEKGATAYVKKVLKSFKDWEFYTGESMDPDAMVILLNYREDGTTPFVAIWKHGAKHEKI